ncbi:transcription elongation factor [Christiangramia sp.]|uniref:transcription elongation factor n=1 Tax=Christiangramia sp. TaxID=1931228 RepID=UPI002609D5BD|nr:transcription elongation factor [Christiangramia sp.]
MKDLERSALIHICQEYLDKKVAVVRNAMNGLKEDLENESKSSAGDKYETGREMINIEWNKLTVQLNEYDRLAQILKRIEEHKPSRKAVLGSIVFTDAANYFISIPAGEIQIAGKKYYAVGVKAPVAQQLLGKEKGDQFVMNGKEFNIIEVI